MSDTGRSVTTASGAHDWETGDLSPSPPPGKNTSSGEGKKPTAAATTRECEGIPCPVHHVDVWSERNSVSQTPSHSLCWEAIQLPPINEPHASCPSYRGTLRQATNDNPSQSWDRGEVKWKWTRNARPPARLSTCLSMVSCPTPAYARQVPRRLSQQRHTEALEPLASHA
jgi:hypothetical protein